MVIPAILDGRLLRLPTVPFGITFASRTTADIRRAIEGVHPELVGVAFELAVIESESDAQSCSAAWLEFVGSAGNDEAEKQQALQELRESAERNSELD